MQIVRRQAGDLIKPGRQPIHHHKRIAACDPHTGGLPGVIEIDPTPSLTGNPPLKRQIIRFSRIMDNHPSGPAEVGHRRSRPGRRLVVTRRRDNPGPLDDGYAGPAEPVTNCPGHLADNLGGELIRDQQSPRRLAD